MKLRRLIVNGDDFGASAEVNEAVILAHRLGILTSASLMVSGEAFEDAVRLAKENNRLSVGLHVTCVDGKSVLGPSEIPHIVDRHQRLPADPALAGLKYFFCPGARKQIALEIAAQFDKFCQSGLPFSHVDSHCHMHVHPVILDAIIENAERYGVKRVRVPADDYFAAVPFLKSPAMAAGYAVIFKLLTGSMKRKLRKRGFKYARRVYGNLMTGSMSRDYALSLLDKLPPGTSEIYLHPSLVASPSSERELQLLRELSILMDSELRSKIARLGIVLSTCFDLEKDS